MSGFERQTIDMPGKTDVNTHDMNAFILNGPGVKAGNITVRMARNPDEVRLAQKIRYDIFYREFHAKPNAEVAALELDVDKFDAHTHHLIVIDETITDPEKAVVGTYRMMDQSGAARAGGFYTSDEFDISRLLSHDGGMLEMGRSCVLPEYRTKAVLQLLWQGIAEFVTFHKIRYLFGCASFHGTDPLEHADAISYLYHYHRAPDEFRPVSLTCPDLPFPLKEAESLDVKAVVRSLPPLIKGYIRIGGVIGDGIYVDNDFNTVDVCVVVSTNLVAQSYLKHYERKTGAEITRD